MEMKTARKTRRDRLGVQQVLWTRGSSKWGKGGHSVLLRPISRPDRALHIVDASILSIFQQNDTSQAGNPYATSDGFSSFDWYLRWLACQISSLPQTVAFLLAEGSGRQEADLSETSRFYRIFISINKLLRSPKVTSIDEIVEHLVENGLLEAASDASNVLVAQRLLVFAILGWQSMLFLPSSENDRPDELSVRQAPGQSESGLVFDTYSVSVDLADRPLPILLKAFGNLLPARRCSPENVASELVKAAYSWTSLSSSNINVYLLHTLLRVEIRWVDTLAHHLDYDKSTQTLSIFRYPSFCIAMLQSKGAIYSFASTETHAADPRATVEEITYFLKETLLSYRLLFGQSKPARKFFRNMLRSGSVLSCNLDPLLRSLCVDEYFAHTLVPADRIVYVTSRDFIILAERVELLGAEMRHAKPQSWRNLISDRRDTVQYWTFWLVAIVGGSGIILSIMQVILAAISVLQSQGGSRSSG